MNKEKLIDRIKKGVAGLAIAGMLIGGGAQVKHNIDLKEENEDLKTSIATLSDEIDKLKATDEDFRLGFVNDEYAKHKGENAKDKIELNKKIDELNNANEALSNEIETLKEGLEDLKEQDTVSEEKLEQIESRITMLDLKNSLNNTFGAYEYVKMTGNMMEDGVDKEAKALCYLSANGSCNFSKIPGEGESYYYYSSEENCWLTAGVYEEDYYYGENDEYDVRITKQNYPTMLIGEFAQHCTYDVENGIYIISYDEQDLITKFYQSKADYDGIDFVEIIEGDSIISIRIESTTKAEYDKAMKQIKNKCLDMINVAKQQESLTK